jgi:hypothetical protein
VRQSCDPRHVGRLGGGGRAACHHALRTCFPVFQLSSSMQRATHSPITILCFSNQPPFSAALARLCLIPRE